MEKINNVTGEDKFMKVFKYYKSNQHKPSLDNVISVDSCVDQVVNIEISTKEDSRAESLGLHKLSEWKQFLFKKHPGLILIKNAFTTLGQRYWIRQCLEDYSKRPNRKNIDIESNIEDWWQECYRGGQLNRKLQKKLRWITLGYHHNWDSKVYSEENKSPFPKDLAELCDIVAGYLDCEGFRSEAAIVNYYHMGSTLSAHTDHSEINLEAPLFSFSFGQSAIFLLGGHEKSIEPSAILLESGDILIMGKEARLCYHAVPKILLANCESWNQNELNLIECNSIHFKHINGNNHMILMNRNADDNEWTKFRSYVEQSRININIRQVLVEHQNSLPENCNSLFNKFDVKYVLFFFCNTSVSTY